MKRLMVLSIAVLSLLIFSTGSFADVVEDFESGSLDNWDMVLGKWKIVRDKQANGSVGNVLQVAEADERGNALVALKCGTEWSDYIVEADIRMDRGADFWMAWRSLNSGQYMAQWQPRGIKANWSSQTRGWGSFGSYRWSWEYGKWYRMKSVLRGGNQKFYIDDALIFEVDDDTHAKTGTVNFRAMQSFMTIDNVVVRGAEGCSDFVRVAIDIKPGSDKNNVNMESKGVLPVAILGSENIKAADIIPSSIKFGPAETHAEKFAVEDVNEDGVDDMLLHFRTQATGLSAEDVSASLCGKTSDRKTFKGSDGVHVKVKKDKKK